MCVPYIIRYILLINQATIVMQYTEALAIKHDGGFFLPQRNCYPWLIFRHTGGESFTTTNVRKNRSPADKHEFNRNSASSNQTLTGEVCKCELESNAGNVFFHLKNGNIFGLYSGGHYRYQLYR